MWWRLLFISLALVVCAASAGSSLGEHEPGGDTAVDPQPPADGEHRMGAIAVERDEDQLWVVHEENRAGDVRAHLTAVDPVSGQSFEVMDVSGTSDRRVVFPADDRMILLAQADSREQLVLFDTTTRQRLASVQADTWFWGTRTSPSGRALVVADNADPLLPIHVIDTATLGHQVIEHGGDLAEAMWNHHEDVLLALSVTDPFGDAPVARLLRYDLRGADLAAPLPEPTVAWELAGYGWDYFFSYTWIGISPDDHWAVFPLIKHTVGPDEDEHVLLVLDQTTGGVTLFPGSGPVGFTRDSRWIVSFGARAADGGQDLWLIDPATGERKVVTMPFEDGVSFIVSRDADYIVCDPLLSVDQPMAIYDLATDSLSTVPTTSFDLWDFVTRPGAGELWLESGGDVYALTFADATLTPIAAGGLRASTINVRPSSDQAVVGDGDAAAIARLDMAGRAVSGPVIELASPFDAPASDTLGAHSAARAARVQSPFDPEYRTELRLRRPGLLTAE